MRKKITFFIFIAFIVTSINAQRVKESPPSFAFDQIANQQLQTAKKLAIPFDVEALKTEDATNESMGYPVRVAKTIPVQFSPENSGEWTNLPNGERIWRLEIDAPNATAISLLYDQFTISKGGKLYIYDLDYNVVNVYTDQDNPKRQEYSTDFIPGDILRLEYVVPNSGTATADGLRLVISGVAYAYKDVAASIESKFKELFDNGDMYPRAPGANNGSDDCEVNANCSEGEAWYHQKRGVAATIQVLSDGSYICSGTVVNNALKDRTPYFLMAYHCGGEATATQFNQWRFYFFWERTGCENTSSLADYKLITGATNKVGILLDGGSDGLLLELNSPIPREWDVFFNGWDRRDVATAGGVGIHHPGGDVKKISTYTQTPTTTTANMSSGERGATNAHWQLAYVATANGHGVTEGGSSGSPLFNSDKRVIGTLTGGSSSCTNRTAANIYGKLSYHWNQSSNQNLWMSKYLDPNNTGIEYLDGTYGEDNLVAFTASATNIYASEEITFTNRSYGDIDTYEWDFGTTTAQPSSYTGQNPPSPILYNEAGSYTVTLTAKKGSTVVDVFSIPITVTLKQNYCPIASPIAIGNPASTTTSAYPLGIQSATSPHALSAAIYTAVELGLTDGGLITDLEWQANTAVSASRTLYIYLKEVDESTFPSNSTWATEINGASLVYEASFTNQAGAVKIHLATPFVYSGAKNLKVLVRSSGSLLQSGNSACIYTAGAADTHQQWTGMTLPTGNGTRNANRPNIKFYYGEPCGVNPPVADFSVSPTTIFEGQTVTITDLSTGPVVTYQWSFPGGKPSASSEVAPTVQYMSAGVYDITLFVKNTEGTSTKTITGAVTVSARTPVPDFASSSNGLIKQADYGPFLPPTGGSVDFESQVLYYPQSLAWSFPGATPSSSTEEYPEVTYPEGANTYDVTLNATNSAGTGTKTKTDYVKVDGTAEVWNMLPGENTTFNLQFNGYSIFNPGATGYFPDGCSERFTAPAGGEVSRVRVHIGAKSGSPSMRVAIHADQGGVPGTLLSEVIIANASITANNYAVANFATPVPVTGAFHVVLTRSSNSGSFRINATDNRSFDYNTACVIYQGTWSVLSDLIGYKASMNVVTEFTFTRAELTSPISFKKKNIDSAPETISFTTDGHSWSATTADAWIHLSATSGLVNGENGSLTFTVDDNEQQALRKGTINLNAAGTAYKIYVFQAGSYPIDLTAAYNDDNSGIEVNWTHDMQVRNTYTKVKRGEIPVSVIGNDETLVPLSVGLKLNDVQKTTKANTNATAIALLPEDLNQGIVLRAATADDDPEEALQWHNDTPQYIYGNPDGGKMEVAIRFTSDDLFFYDKATIKAVFIYTYRPCNNVILNIRQGNQIIHSQSIGNLTENLLEQRIELTTPVLIDASKDLLIGYEYEQFVGDPQDVWIPIADAGPAVTGKGNLFSLNGAPFAPTGPGNWIITAYVQPATVDLTFNLYRDGALIAEGLTEKTYLDTEELPKGTQVCYTVTAVYGDPELESTESDEACLYTDFIEIEGDTEFCQGESATLKAPEDPDYTYQWYKDGTPIDDGTESSYVATESGDYHVVITTQTSEVLTSETVTITVYALPTAPVISIDTNPIAAGNSATITIESPQADLLYQWYKDSAALDDPSDETSITVDESGTYYVVAVNENGCVSNPSNEIELEIISLADLFTPSVNEEDFVAQGESQTITITINDPDDLIGSMGLNFYINTPDWITYTVSGNVISFTANANTTGVIQTGVIQIWLGQDGSTFDLNNGYEIPVSQKSRLLASMLNYSFADAVYSGETHPASVTLKSTYSGLGAITVLYNGSINAPIEIGNYTVSINAAEGTNFEGVSNLVLGSFTISKAALTIRPDDASRQYGTANPNFTVAVIGLVGHDSRTDLGNITVTTTATLYSLPGTYAIVASGAQNSNYAITYQEGALTINQLSQIIDNSQSTISMEVGEVFQINASTSSGLAVTYTSSNPSIAEVGSNGIVKALSEGTVTITLSQSGNAIYAAAENVIIQLTVTDLTGIDQIASQSITVYPNPAAKSAPVYVNADIDASLLDGAIINIYDASGSLVKNLKVTGKLTKVELPAATNTYIFSLRGKDGAIIKSMRVIVK